MRKIKGWKLWTGVVFLSTILLGFLFIQTAILIGTFFDTNKIVRHQIISIKINPPFTIEPREVVAIISPVPTKEQLKPIVAKAEAKGGAESSMPVFAEPAGLNDIVADIRMLESGNGKAPQGHHVTCRNQGKSNEYGYGARNGFCFDSHEEATLRVKRWFTEKLNEYPLNQALCIYETGSALEDCTYYQSYLKLQ